MRRVWKGLAVISVLGSLAGGAVVGFGLYNVSARAGHLPGVSWILHTTFRNSVRLRAPKPEHIPDLTDPSLIELGARHFDTACRTCHAAPGKAQSATMAAMVPVPPHIVTAVEGWQPHHLHWIVKNGAKMTGMPAWPSERDDEVWSVVAFLTSVQRGMGGAEYAALTRQPEREAQQDYCLSCHGQGGSAHVPPLDRQSAAYLEMSLRAYLAGTRASGIMAQAVSEVPPETLDDLARWFATTPSERPAPPEMPPQLVEQGRVLAQAAQADTDVPACATCHGPGASEASARFPLLSGLPAPYLQSQLQLWREARRGGGQQAELMRKAARKLSDEDIGAIIAYYATLSAEENDTEDD